MKYRNFLYKLLFNNCIFVHSIITKKQQIFALSLKNSSIRDTRHLELQYLTHQNTQIPKYWTQKAETVLQIFFVFEVITSMKINKGNIETFYTNYF